MTNKRIEITFQDFKKLIKDRQLTKNGITIDLHSRLTPDKMDDVVYDVKTEAWKKEYEKDGKDKPHSGYFGGKNYDSWSKDWNKPRFGDYKEGKDVVYEGSPFDEDSKEELDVLDPKNFEEDVLKADKPVLVKYSADWCTSCKDIAPLAAKLAKEMKDVDFYALDVKDPEGKAIAKKQGIDAIPTFIRYEKGKEVERVVGPSPDELEDFVRPFVLIAKREEDPGKV